MLQSGAGRGFSEEVRMARRRHTPEQIITALREAEVGLANGKTVALVSRELGISEQTYYRWRQEFGGMKVDQARRLKEFEKENGRLKRAVANLTLDKLILEEAAKGNF
jgi:transposase-like protein